MVLSSIIISFIVTFVLTTLVTRYIRMRRNAKLIDKLPGPKSYPLVGTVLDDMVPEEELFRNWVARGLKYRPIYRLWAGAIPVVSISKPDYMEIILKSSRNIEKGPTYEAILPWLGNGLLTSGGEKWFSHRKMITPTFHFNILENFVETFQLKSEILVEKLESHVKNSEEFDIYPYVTKCTLDIICDTAMGVNLDVQNNSSSKYVEAVYKEAMLIIRRILRPWYWPNIIYNLTSDGKKHKKCIDILHGFTNDVIKERKKNKQRSSENQETIEDIDKGKKKRLAFLDILLDASQNSKTPMSDEEIREEVDTFMFEGHDTTTCGISWSIYLLGLYPDIQEKVHAELNEIFADDPNRKIDMRDLNEMKYLERVIKESLRLYPSVPLIGRTLSEDVQFDDFFIPKGTAIQLEIVVTHRSPDVWENPDIFDPDRFLNENIKKRHNYAYIPFSAGPRNCIGQKFALLEEKCILASIFRKYKVVSMETRDKMVELVDLILRPNNGVKVKVLSR